MLYKDHIEEFCFTETDVIYSQVRKRRSILISFQRDIDFNLGIYKIFKALELTKEQIENLEDLTPSLVVPLLYCSAVDLLARVSYATNPPRGKNREWFIESAIKFFDLAPNHAEELWKFRNSLSHSYSIKDYTIASGGISKNVYEENNNRKVFFTKKMRGSLQRAIARLHEHLQLVPVSSAKSGDVTQDMIMRYIEDYGFSYYLID